MDPETKTLRDKLTHEKFISLALKYQNKQLYSGFTNKKEMLTHLKVKLDEQQKLMKDNEKLVKGYAQMSKN